jgi:3-oxoacyl-[acyl-carrier-protein] synthase II
MSGVVITGIGLVGSTGPGKDQFWRALLTSESAVRPITRLDAAGYSSRIAAEVRDHTYEDSIEPRKLRSTTLGVQMALAATEYALRDARLTPDHFAACDRGVVLGTALGGWRDAEQQFGILLERGSRRVNPFIANGAPNHNAGVEIASKIGARGPQMTFSTGCPSSLQAIAHAATLIRSGQVAMCLAGGFETPISHLVLSGMTRTQELSTGNDNPTRASRPFDRAHCGLVLGEGSCLLVLESEENAVRRGAKMYAKVIGDAMSCDAVGVYGVDASGETAALTIQRAISRGGISPSDIDYVCSHANSSIAFDRKEALVLRRAFGEQVARLPVSSIKGVMGHPFGASGAFQVAAACLAIEHQILPPNTNLDDPDPECPLHLIRGEPLPAAVRHALVTSYGYGGVNAYLILGRP